MRNLHFNSTALAMLLRNRIKQHITKCQYASILAFTKEQQILYILRSLSEG